MGKRRARSERRVFAIVSDMHCGSTVALCPPEISLDDGGYYGASKAQRWLWQCWGDLWQRAGEIRDREDAELLVAFNGDITEGSHHGTTQILSGNPTAQAAVVDACMSVPLSLQPDRLFFVRGTEAHVGASAAHEERIARGLLKDGRPVVGDPSTGTASWWHLRMEVGPFLLDLAHHGKMGQLPWTKPAAVSRHALQVFTEHALRGERHPDLALRSHFHQWGDSYDACPTRMIQLPAWQLATAYIHRIAPGAVADVGGLIVVVRNGEYEVEKVRFTPERSAPWKESA